LHKHTFTANAESGTYNMSQRSIYDFSYVRW